MIEICVLFHNHFGAIDFEKKFKSNLIEFKLQPTPRTLSSSCGVAAIFYLDSNYDIGPYITDHVAEIYKNEKGKYILLYE